MHHSHQTITHCQCGQPNCNLWIELDQTHAHEATHPSHYIVAPTHLHPADKLITLTTSYAVTTNDPTAI